MGSSTQLETPRMKPAEYVLSPAEQADRQIRSFPYHSLDSLARELQLNSLDRVLNLGGGVGVLASHLSALREDTGMVVLAENEQAYLDVDLPPSLFYRSAVETHRVDYRRLPFQSGSFDGVILNDFLSLFPGEDRTEVIREVKRVMSDNARLFVIESRDSIDWTPSELSAPEEERNRLQEFKSLRREVHREAGTRLFKTFDELPSWLADTGFDLVKTGGWFLPARLNDSRWTERQRTDLINLRHQAQRDRVEIVRRLLNATGRWKEEHASLLRNVASDSQQQALRKRKALESDRETGWAGVPMILVQATIPSDH